MYVYTLSICLQLCQSNIFPIPAVVLKLVVVAVAAVDLYPPEQLCIFVEEAEGIELPIAKFVTRWS